MKTFSDWMASENLGQPAPQVNLQILKSIVQNMRYFASFNQTHLGRYSKDPNGQREISAVTRWLSQQFDELMKIDIKNDGQLGRNEPGILKFARELLTYVKPLYQKYIPNNIPPTLVEIEKLYNQAVSGRAI